MLDHYARQLEAHGWSAAAQGQDGALGWRTATHDFGGQHWVMLLYAIRKPDRPGTYMLQLEANAR